MYDDLIKLKIPPPYIFNGTSIFANAKQLGLPFIISRYGQSEGIMVWYHATQNYNDIVSYWYSTQNDFLRKYTAWKVALKTKMKNALHDYLVIQSNNSRLKRFIKQECTKPDIQREYIRYNLKLYKPIFDTTKLIEIFDNVEVNEYTTIVMLIQNYERKYKIFDSPYMYKIDYTKITNRNDDDGIWIYNLTGSDPMNINSYTVSNILPSEEHMHISCESYIDWKVFLDESIYRELSNSTVRINFSFQIVPDRKIKWPLWYYGLATSDFASTWLYITETTNVYTQVPNDVPAINFKDYKNTISTALGSFRMKETETGISVKANKVLSRKIMEDIYDIVPRLLTWYLMNESSLMEEINEILPDYIFESEEVDYIANTKYRALKNALPYLFEGEEVQELNSAETVTFGTACQGKNQPVFIDESEVEEFKLLGPQHTFGVYPPPHPDGQTKHATSSQIFICPTEHAPYASLTSNLDPKTSNEYPLIPCCSRSDRFDKSTVEFWERYRNPIMKLSYGNKGAVLSNKRLAIKAQGKVPKSLESVLSTVLNLGFESTFVRVGTANIGYSSILACLLSECYEDIADWIEWDGKFLKDLRREIFKKINPLVLRQQLWYLSESDIKKELLSMQESNKAIDSSKWIAALEEAFNVNIYVFTNDTYEIPECKDFYIKQRRYERKSVVLWKHLADSDLDYVTYDYINFRERGNTYPMHYIPGHSIKLHTIYEMYSQTFIFKKYNGIWMKESSCVFDIPSLLEESNMDLLGVSFDEFGKVRYHHVLYKGRKFTFIIPPNSYVNQNTIELKDTLYQQPISVIHEVFGSYGVEKSNIIWYDIGEWFLELGVVASKSYVNIQSQVSETEKSNATKLLIEVTEYLWKSTDKNFNIDSFMNLCFIVDEREERLPSVSSRYLPQFSTFQETLSYIEKIFTPYDDGIIVKGDVFNSIKIYLKRKVKSSYIVTKKFLSKNYDLVEMFQQFSNMRIFLSRTDFELWNSSSSRNPLILFNTKLIPSLYTYTYYSDNGSFYYIHNAENFSDAIYKSYTLLFPHLSKNINIEDIPIMLYRAINETYLQRVKTKQTFDKQPKFFAQVIIYQNGEYGAMEEVYRP